VRLRVSRSEADRKLGEQINRGNELLATPIHSPEEYEAVDGEFSAWNDYCRDLLKALFTTEELFQEFASRGPKAIRAYPTLGQIVGDLREEIKEDLLTLTSIRKRLELFEEPAPPQSAPERAAALPPGRAVFIVHGRNDGVKNTVARVIERLGLKAVILHEQPDGGRTLIEKFEQESSDAGFAVVLLTPDDLGALQGEPMNLKPRARQNVVLELGFLFGKLGRGRVRALFVEGVELPSDLAGYIYIPLDENGAWQMLLGREMKAAGLPVDLNRLA
jgi:predicted nucleotide-binding protein